MEIFLKILQGSYAYLLIFQVLVVSLLMLASIWLVIRRTQEAGIGIEPSLPPMPDLTATPADPGQLATPPLVIHQASPETEAQLVEARAKLNSLAEENEKLKGSGTDSNALKEKVNIWSPGFWSTRSCRKRSGP